MKTIVDEYATYTYEDENNCFVKLISCRLASPEGLTWVDIRYGLKTKHLQGNPDKCTFELLELLHREISDLFDGEIVFATDIDQGLVCIEIKDNQTGEQLIVWPTDKTTIEDIALAIKEAEMQSNIEGDTIVMPSCQCPHFFWLMFELHRLEVELRTKRDAADLDMQISKLPIAIPTETISVNKNIETPDLSREGVKWLFSALRREKAICNVSGAKLSGAVSSITGYSAEKLRQNMQSADLTDDTRTKLKSMLSKLLGELE